MITMKQWMETIDYRITEGSDYGWRCYGDNAYQMDSWDGDWDGANFGIVFDTKTQEIYEVTAFDYRNQRAYRMINPLYQTAYFDESKNRQVDPNQAFDDLNFVDLECDEDWLEKAAAIRDNQVYDTRIKVPIDLEKSEIFELMMRAHQQDITLNQLVERILQATIDREKSTF